MLVMEMPFSRGLYEEGSLLSPHSTCATLAGCQAEVQVVPALPSSALLPAVIVASSFPGMMDLPTCGHADNQEPCGLVRKRLIEELLISGLSSESKHQ